MQVGDLLLQIGNVSSSCVSSQETMAQVASVVRVGFFQISCLTFTCGACCGEGKVIAKHRM